MSEVDPAVSQPTPVDTADWIEAEIVPAGAEIETTDRNVFQKIMDATGGVVTPANMIDTAAIIGSFPASARLNTWKGYLTALALYEVDHVDGWLARRTGTVSWLGEYLDHVGDKLKFVPGLYYAKKYNLAPASLLAGIALQQSATAAVTVADRVINKDNPKITEVDEESRKWFFATSWGLGIAIGGELLAKTHPRAGKAAKVAGTALAWLGVARGAQATYGYAQQMMEELAPLTE